MKKMAAIVLGNPGCAVAERISRGVGALTGTAMATR